MAEWEGFEPSHACASNDLANRPLQPLEYHSVLYPYEIIWQGQKDLNPQPTVLETATLPIELYPYEWSGKRDSNPRPSPWQGDALPLSYFRKNGDPERI